MKTGIVLVVALLGALNATAGVILVEKGQPKAVIVVPAQAPDQVREAATLLQDYLQRISGAKLDIRDDAVPVSGPCIAVGNGPTARRVGVDIPPRFTNAMNEEEYRIRVTGDTVVLAGNEHPFYRGTVYAVDDFLERLGCRWFFPGVFGEVIPKQETIEVPGMDVREQPDFRFRNIWYSGWMPVQGNEGQEYTTWMDRNRMNSLAKLSLPGDGSITRLAPADQYFADHPNIYAINKKGERDREMLCLTEPEAVTIAAETIKAAFRADPNLVTFGFAPPDGHPQCFCERCQESSPNFCGKGYGEPSLSDVWFRFANAVAKEVNKEFPDRWLLTNGYANRVRIPEGIDELSPNLGIQSAMLDSCTFHSIGDPKCWQRQLYKAVLDQWTEKLRCVFIYDYDPGKSLDGMPFPMLHNLERDFRYFKDRGVWGFWTEGQNCWMVTHLNYYIRARLMWDADADVKALVRDYCEQFYGAAAKPIEKYIWTMEHAVDDCAIHETFGRMVPWRAICTPAVMKKLDRLMEDAVQQTANRPEAARVRVLDLVHQHTQAHLAMEERGADANFTGAVEKADEMLRLRGELCAVNPSLIPVTPEWCRDGHGAPEWYRETWQELADRVNGTNGTLIAMTPREWQWRRDPEDIGVFYRWYTPETKGDWDELDTTLYWEAQGKQDEKGYGVTGKAWYRSDFDVPASAAGRPLTLTFGGVYSAELWVWVNNQLVNHEDHQDTKGLLDIDVTKQIRPGEKNHAAMLIKTLDPGRNARGGLHRRVFLWSPNRP